MLLVSCGPIGVFGGNEHDKYRYSSRFGRTITGCSVMTEKKLTWMVNDTSAEFMELDTEPESESLWWTSRHKAEDEVALQVGSWGKSWEVSFVEEFDFFGVPVSKGIRVAERTLKIGMGS